MRQKYLFLKSENMTGVGNWLEGYIPSPNDGNV